MNRIFIKGFTTGFISCILIIILGIFCLYEIDIRYHIISEPCDTIIVDVTEEEMRLMQEQEQRIIDSLRAIPPKNYRENGRTGK